MEWLKIIAVGISVLVAAAVTIAVAYMVIIWAPVAAFAEAKCLAAGYPEVRVTWHLKKYCMNLDGTVTITVDELE